jgi:hypothetical protein
MIALVAVVAISCIGSGAQAKKRWVASITLMELEPPGASSRRTQPGDERRLNDLVRIALSSEVLGKSAETLWALNIPEPESLLATLDVKPIPESNVLLIQITDEDERMAKTAVGVVASSFAAYYKELAEEHWGTELKPALVVINPVQARPAPPAKPRIVFWIRGLRGAPMAVIGLIVIAAFATGLLIGLRTRMRARLESNGPRSADDSGRSL